MWRLAIMLCAGGVLVGCAHAPHHSSVGTAHDNAPRVYTASLYASDISAPSPAPPVEAEASPLAELSTNEAVAALDRTGAEPAPVVLAAGDMPSDGSEVLAGDTLPVYRFEAYREEWLRDVLHRWCRAHDVELIWLATCDYPVVVPATFEASSLEGAVRQLMRNAWHPSCSLTANEAANNVLVIQ